MAQRDDHEEPEFAEAIGRPALPAGDPLTWEVLVSGTCLEGMAWPGWGVGGWGAPIQDSLS